MAGNESRKLRLFSDGSAGIVVSSHQTLFQDSLALPAAFCYGQITEYKEICCQGPAQLIIIVFHPEGLNRLLNVPASELNDKIIPLTDLFDKCAPEKRAVAFVQFSPKNFVQFRHMEKLIMATAQFEHRSGDKAYNLGTIERMTANASAQGAKVIAFHECSITGYTFARKLSKTQMLDLAELIPDGPSIKRLAAISGAYGVAILAGLFEKDEQQRLYKSYVCVDKNGLVAKFRKLPPLSTPISVLGMSTVFSTFSAGNAAF